MSLLFSQPWMLLGLMAAALPLLVYRFLRPKPLPRPFGPMAFVLSSLQRTTSLWRLRRLLIYILRALLVLALALALARPWLDKGATAAAALQGEAATALVLDASFSMRYADGKQAFEVAKSRALEVVEALSEAEAFTVVLCDGRHTPTPPLSHEKAFWRRYLQEARPSFLPAVLNNCMETAVQLLQQNPMEAKRLVVVSDFARHTLHMSVPPPQLRDANGDMRLPWVVLHAVHEGQKPPQNRALLSLEAEGAEEGGRFAFVATVQNFGPVPQKDVELELRVNGQNVARGLVDLAAYGSARKTLSAPLAPNIGHEVEIRLAGDALPEDDAQTLWLRPRGELRVLLIDGAPSADRQADEAYFVELALAQLPQARVVLRDSQAAWRENLSHYSVVFMLNTPPPPKEATTALKAFVEAGGGLWVSLGDNLQLEAWNQAMAAFLPRPLRWLKGTSAKISPPQSPHPVLQPFIGEGLEGLLAARFSRYALLEAHAEEAKPMEVLLRLDEGAPLLVAHALGRGQVLTYASSADRDWNDLPLRTAFLPLIQRSAQWLSNSLLDKEVPTTTVGQTIRLPSPQSTYIGPNGEEVEPEPDGADYVQLGPLSAPGLWWPKGRGEQAVPVWAKPLVQESDLALLEMDEVRAWFGNPHIAEAGGERRRPLWTVLLFLGFVVFCAELWLLVKP
ncbi:MAG: BatA and WFA domain-containing protein [Proteobacteria bacterium]|nr:BatA and WFA domain-containing protein [Cystobacterineae bacterium]MCL2258446.1 BatA and WFA domain-containing protein [Cystobacterineae bacterium]MCL2315215.1 BatA and WFA domain-containing protein [Pseudomonadota bacterium]